MEDRAKSSPSPRDTAVPAGILSAVTAAQPTADVLQLGGEPLRFPDQVLKVETLVFLPGGRLLMTGNTNDWLAVVAKTVIFNAPDELGEIGVLPDESIHEHPDPPSLGTAREGLEGGPPSAPSNAGTKGDDGIDGAQGEPGLPAKTAPRLYVIAGEVAVQEGGGTPSNITLNVWNVGRYAGVGGRGQDGQNGGRGGKGRRGAQDGVKCIRKPGNGGPGGKGGAGGDGGMAGASGAGGDVHFAGSRAAVRLLVSSNVRNYGGPPGIGGLAGKNGAEGKGGPRGSRPGRCDGGSDGPDGPVQTAKPKSGAYTAEGSKGAILQAVIDVDRLYS